MGRKRSRTRQCLFVCAAGLIMVALGACATGPFRVISAELESRTHLQRAKDQLARRDFEGAFQENLQVLALFPQKPPGDAALFNLGMIQVHYANSKKDNRKALGFFTRLVKEFPESPHTAEAKSWLALLKALETKVEEEKGAQVQRLQLQRTDQLIGQGDFEGALRENEKVLALSLKSPPGDIALFNMGLIQIHYANPKKDIGEALRCFRQLAGEFPRSPLAEQARIWAGVLETMEKTKLIDIEIEKKKKGLRR